MAERTPPTRMNCVRCSKIVYADVEAQVERYQKSNPGDDELTSNTKVHSLIHGVIEAKTDRSRKSLIKLSNALSYRLDLIDTVKIYIYRLEIEKPRGRSFQDFNLNHFSIGLSKLESENAKAIKDWLHHGLNEVLFPSPSIGAGREFSKPFHYFHAALTCSSLPEEELQDRVTWLVGQIKETACWDEELIYGCQEAERREILREFDSEICGLSTGCSVTVDDLLDDEGVQVDGKVQLKKERGHVGYPEVRE